MGAFSLLRAARFVLALTACASVVVPAAAQTLGNQSQAYPSNYPPALPKRKGTPPPRLAFKVVSEIELPDRLADATPEVTEEGVRVPLTGSVAVTSLDPGSQPRIHPPLPSPPPDEAVSPWVASADGRLRFQARRAGLVVAEKRCRLCRGGFKRQFRLHIPGVTSAPPLVLGRRLFFASRDDRVYCVRADNGHRVWAVDVGDRVSRPLALWSGVVPGAAGQGPDLPSTPLDLILVSLDGGGALLALDPYDGSSVGILDVPASEGKLATGVAATQDGRVVVGRERYAVSEGMLMVLRLELAPESAAESDSKPQSPYDKVTLPHGGS